MSGTITPSLNQGLFLGSTSGTITVQAIATAGTHTVTLPAQTGTVAVELIGTTGTIGGGALAAGASAAPWRWPERRQAWRLSFRPRLIRKSMPIMLSRSGDTYHRRAR